MGYSNKYSDDLYRYLKSKGYADEMIAKAGLITVDEKKGVYDKILEPGDVPDYGCEYRVIGLAAV